MLPAILDQGAYVIVSCAAGQSALLQKSRSRIAEGVESLEGLEARRTIERRGLGALHEVMPAGQIGALRDFVMPAIRADLLALACGIGRTFLGIDGEFFVDDYTILRINYPYLIARQAPVSAENPGIGRVAERTRQESQASRVVDPVYDPKGYHHHEPPPAWAHGPHQDTWTGHSRLGVNLWWALEDVPEECSMVFYPETFGRPFAVDPRSLYLREGQPLPKPTKMSLRRGEMLIFNPEMLHGTHLNTANVTRVALSIRLNPRRPLFDPGCFYAREFWHSSTDIEGGRIDEIVRFRREDNLDPGAAPPAAIVESTPDVVTVNGSGQQEEWQPVCPSPRLPAGGKLLVRAEGADDVLVMRGEQALHATEARCPHLGVSLADGYHDDAHIWCPAHAVTFSLGTGESSCDAIRLRTHEVREEGGTVYLRRRTETSL